MKNFTRINSLTLYGSKVEEDPKNFIDESYKIVYGMGLNTSEMDNIATYQLQDVAQTWYFQWRGSRPLWGGHVTWEILKKDFPDRFFLRENMEAKVDEFNNLRQGVRSVLDYSLKFTKSSKYVHSLVSTLGMT